MLAAVRSAVRAAKVPAQVRRMSSGVSHAEEVKEMNKWRIVTFLAVPACAVKAFIDLSHSHHHSAEKPAFPYLNIRSKDFPWGKKSLLE